MRAGHGLPSCEEAPDEMRSRADLLTGFSYI